MGNRSLKEKKLRSFLFEFQTTTSFVLVRYLMASLEILFFNSLEYFPKNDKDFHLTSLINGFGLWLNFFMQK